MPELPEFRYHPDPIATGFVVAADATCVRCDQQRGYVYTGPVFCAEEITDELCPWCIADGSAAEEFDADFSDDLNVPDGVPDEVVDVVLHRTPGFAGWQQESWLYHCDDAAAFHGRVGHAELQAHPTLLAELVDELGEKYVRMLDATTAPTAYLFTCLHCGTDLAYSDAD